MKKYLFAFCLLAIIPSVSAAGVGFADSRDKTSYAVSIGKDFARRMSVRAEITLKNDVIYMSPNGAGQLPEGWAKFVRNLKFTTRRVIRYRLRRSKAASGK